ncbi:hypothetical protein ACFL6E_03490 [Candidatus Neomarinimicrobiota bacterium]
MQIGDIKSIKNLAKFAWDSPTITTWGNFFFASIKGITILPLLLNRFNNQEVAVWLLFSSVIIFSNIFDFGFHATFSRVVSYVMGGATSLEGFRDRAKQENLKKTNWVLMEAIYGTMGFIFAIVGLIALILLATLGSLSVAETISSSQNQPDLWAAWAYLVLSLSIFIYGRKYGTALHGMNYVALVNRWNMLFSLLGIIFGILAIFLFNSILYLVIVLQTFSILSILRDRYLLKSKVQDTRFKQFKSFKWDGGVIKSVWAPSWRTAIGMVASSGVVEITGIIYAQVANAENLVSYLLALRIIGLINGVARAPFYSKLPQYAKLRAEGKISELATRANLGIRFSLYIFILGTFLVGILFEPLLVLINANAQFVPMGMWILISSIWFLERHHAMHAQVYGTTNHIPFYLPITISGTITILLSLVLLKYIDYWAFPLAQGIANLLINNWWNVKISLKSLDVVPIRFLTNSFIYPALVFIILQLLLTVI